MNLSAIKSSPILLRVGPYAIFLALTFCQNYFGEQGRYWVYFAKTLAGAGLILAVYPLVAEMRWRASWAGLAVGIAVFVMWIGLSGFLTWLGINPSFSELKTTVKNWNPFATFGHGAEAWLFAGIRVLGSALVVPFLEEVFFRSFVYRYLIKADFQSVSLGQFSLAPFMLTSLIFGLEHREWLAGLLCGLAYQGLVIWKKRLGDAIMAHGLTNLLLGIWVVWKGDWHFW